MNEQELPGKLSFWVEVVATYLGVATGALMIFLVKDVIIFETISLGQTGMIALGFTIVTKVLFFWHSKIPSLKILQKKVISQRF